MFTRASNGGSSLSNYVKCKVCNGKGYQPTNDEAIMEDCYKCNGLGYVHKPDEGGSG